MCVPGCREAVHRAMSRRSFVAVVATAGTLATSVQAKQSFTTVVDLTHTLSPAFPTFFGTPGIAIDRRYTCGRRECRLVARAGACRDHVDAPFHYSDSGDGGEDPARAAGGAARGDRRVGQGARNADYQLSRQDLADWEEKHGRLPDNAASR